MNRQMKLTLALIQVENISSLLSDGPYAEFFTSHLLPIRYEIERQQSLLTNTNRYTTNQE